MCDECGTVGENYVNQSVAYTRMEKIARHRYGWHISKSGKWVCPYCWERLQEKDNDTNSKQRSEPIETVDLMEILGIK